MSPLFSRNRNDCPFMKHIAPMSAIISRSEIEATIAQVDAIAAMERALADYSAGRANITPVGEILFPEMDGEAHIKSGHISGDDVFVVKVATGFYRNADNGLPSNSGVVLVFSARTGMLHSILLDGGYLTDVRTAAAGAVAAKYLAPANISRIGILGTGVQARLQAEMLKGVTACRSILLWGRRAQATEDCARDLEGRGYTVEISDTPAQVAKEANLIVTVTASKTPLLAAGDIRPGTHITAVGADTAEKQELASDLVATADIIAVDSLIQSRERGELRHVVLDAPATTQKAVELGSIVSGRASGRISENQITIADLTGVAVQDIEIAKAVLRAIGKLT